MKIRLILTVMAFMMITIQASAITYQKMENFTDEANNFFETSGVVSGDYGIVTSYDDLGGGNKALNISWNNSVYQKRTYRFSTSANESFVNTTSFRLKVPNITRSIILDFTYQHGGNPDNVVFRFSPVGSDEVWQYTGATTYIVSKVPRIARGEFFTMNVTFNKTGTSQWYAIEINGSTFNSTVYTAANSNVVSSLQIDAYAYSNNTYLVLDYIYGSSTNESYTASNPVPAPLTYTLATTRPAWENTTIYTWDAGDTGQWNYYYPRNISKFGMMLDIAYTDTVIDNVYSNLTNTSIIHDVYIQTLARNGFYHTTNASRRYGTDVALGLNQSERIRLIKDMGNLSLTNPKFKGIIFDEAMTLTATEIDELWANRTNPNFEIRYYLTYYDSTSDIRYAKGNQIESVNRSSHNYTSFGHFYRNGTTTSYNYTYLYETLLNQYYDCACLPLFGYYIGGTTTPAGTNESTQAVLNASLTLISQGYGGGVSLYGFYGQATTNNGTWTNERLNWYRGLAEQAGETPTYTPPVPVWVSNITGSSWVNHTWQAGSGNITDSYNVSHNGTWYNGTTNTSFNTSLAELEWSNITIWAFNNSGGLSSTSISNNSQVPASPATPTTPTTNTTRSRYYEQSCSDILSLETFFFGIFGVAISIIVISGAFKALKGEDISLDFLFVAVIITIIGLAVMTTIPFLIELIEC